MTMNNVISKILLYGFIILGALVSLFPFYWLAVRRHSCGSRRSWCSAGSS